MMARRALIARGAFAVRGMPRSFRCHARAGGASTVLACCILEARNSLEPFGSLDAVVGERLPSGSHVHKHIPMLGRFRLMCKRPAFFGMLPVFRRASAEVAGARRRMELMRPPTQA